MATHELLLLFARFLIMKLFVVANGVKLSETGQQLSAGFPLA